MSAEGCDWPTLIAELADNWTGKYREHISAALKTDSEYEAGLQMASGSVRELCADELRALLAGGVIHVDQEGVPR